MHIRLGKYPKNTELIHMEYTYLYNKYIEPNFSIETNSGNQRPICLQGHKPPEAKASFLEIETIVPKIDAKQNRIGCGIAICRVFSLTIFIAQAKIDAAIQTI